ncbi:MAG: hypothetical protein Q8J84_08155 [Flavobacteriaceae bacterium]|nr:hypothetical protein [Flavobacteriaceae bacterium]
MKLEYSIFSEIILISRIKSIHFQSQKKSYELVMRGFTVKVLAMDNINSLQIGDKINYGKSL